MGELRWSVTNQDTSYYPMTLLSFLLCFRSQECMGRYQLACGA